MSNSSAVKNNQIQSTENARMGYYTTNGHKLSFLN